MVTTWFTQQLQSGDAWPEIEVYVTLWLQPTPSIHCTSCYRSSVSCTVISHDLVRFYRSFRDLRPLPRRQAPASLSEVRGIAPDTTWTDMMEQNPTRVTLHVCSLWYDTRRRILRTPSLFLLYHNIIVSFCSSGTFWQGQENHTLIVIFGKCSWNKKLYDQLMHVFFFLSRICLEQHNLVHILLNAFIFPSEF